MASGKVEEDKKVCICVKLVPSISSNSLFVWLVSFDKMFARFKTLPVYNSYNLQLKKKKQHTNLPIDW